MRWGSAYLAALVGCSAMACTPLDDPRPPGPPSLGEVAPPLQAALDAWAAVSGHRGVSATVILADGQEWKGSAGVAAPGAALQPGDLLSIASITKTMTGAVILQLAQEGVLALDDPVSAWLPAIHDVDPAITLRQLLNHTNGLANYTASPELAAAIASDPLHRFTPQELLGYVGPSEFPPGTRTQYTNTAFLLLGMVAEAAGGHPITELWRDRLWAPLGLTAVFLPGAQDPPGIVAGAWTGPDAATPVDPLRRMAILTVGQSAFGLFADADVVARWGRALFAGPVLASTMRSQMLKLVLAAGNIPGESGAGLGIRSYAYLGRTQYGHSGGSAFGSSLLLFDPTSGVTVAVLTNQGTGAGHFDLAPRLLALAAGG